jgi:tetratricopeptide (TPR) repeat protein
VTSLVAASDALGYRPVEARLTGGFRWAEFRGAVRSTSAARTPGRLKLDGAAGESLQRAESDPSPQAQHAAGVASLLIEDPAAGIERLAKLTAEQPLNAGAWNDLAAAHLDAAIRFGRASEVPLALAAADRALRIEPKMPEALFNRALIVERIGLLDEAGRAWQQYLAADAEAEWAREARTRLEALPKSGKMPASTRSSMETEVLGQWGEATLNNADADAGKQLAMARGAGVALRGRGEALLADEVAAIDMAIDDIRPEDRQQLAAAHAA